MSSPEKAKEKDIVAELDLRLFGRAGARCYFCKLIDSDAVCARVNVVG